MTKLRVLRDSVVLIPSPLAKNRCGKAIFNRDNGACPLVGVFFDNQKTQRGLLERALRAFRPIVDSFWNVPMSQRLEWSALATSPRDKTQDFRRESWDPSAEEKNQLGVAEGLQTKQTSQTWQS